MPCCNWAERASISGVRVESGSRRDGGDAVNGRGDDAADICGDDVYEGGASEPTL